MNAPVSLHTQYVTNIVCQWTHVVCFLSLHNFFLSLLLLVRCILSLSQAFLNNKYLVATRNPTQDCLLNAQALCHWATTTLGLIPGGDQIFLILYFFFLMSKRRLRRNIKTIFFNISYMRDTMVHEKEIKMGTKRPQFIKQSVISPHQTTILHIYRMEQNSKLSYGTYCTLSTGSKWRIDIDTSHTHTYQQIWTVSRGPVLGTAEMSPNSVGKPSSGTRLPL